MSVDPYYLLSFDSMRKDIERVLDPSNQPVDFDSFLRGKAYQQRRVNGFILLEKDKHALLLLVDETFAGFYNRDDVSESIDLLFAPYRDNVRRPSGISISQLALLNPAVGLDQVITVYVHEFQKRLSTKVYLFYNPSADVNEVANSGGHLRLAILGEVSRSFEAILEDILRAKEPHAPYVQFFNEMQAFFERCLGKRFPENVVGISSLLDNSRTNGARFDEQFLDFGYQDKSFEIRQVMPNGFFSHLHNFLLETKKMEWLEAYVEGLNCVYRYLDHLQRPRFEHPLARLL